MKIYNGTQIVKQIGLSGPSNYRVYLLHAFIFEDETKINLVYTIRQQANGHLVLDAYANIHQNKTITLQSRLYTSLDLEMIYIITKNMINIDNGGVLLGNNGDSIEP